MIESLQAEVVATSDVPVRFDLTVAPDDAAAYRVEFTQDINVVELPDYRPRGVLVVQYPPDKPWRVRIVKRPTPDWEERAAEARLDSAPESTRVSAREAGCGTCLGALVLLLLVAAGVLALVFHNDLFGPNAATVPQSSAPTSVSATSSTSSSTTSTTIETSMSSTVALGSNQSFLDDGELSQTMDSLIKDGGTRQALTVVVQERQLSVVFSPSGSQAPAFDPRSLPYGRFPALVKEASSTLGVHSPQTWLISVERLDGSVTITVTVTGSNGAASLEANGQGAVVRWDPLS